MFEVPLKRMNVRFFYLRTDGNTTLSFQANDGANLIVQKLHCAEIYFKLHVQADNKWPLS